MSRRDCVRVLAPGTLGPPIRRSGEYGVEYERWACGCGANGNWLRTDRLRDITVRRRLEAQYAGHVARQRRGELK